MKKSKFLALAAFGAIAVSGLTGCGNSGNTVTLWVGSESVNFYTEVANEFIASQEEGSEFSKFKVKVVGTDTGTAAASVIQDKNAGGDIFTVAHDNIGKLVQNNCVKPILDESLIKQVDDDNPEAYKDVIHSTVNEQSYLFGVPYISQALFMYYRKDLVSEEQAKTFEGLQEAAKAVSSKTKALTVTGTDGFNFSFTVLARKASDNSTTVKIYEGGNRSSCYFQGEDTTAVTKWAQRVYADPNGLSFPSSSGWAVDIQAKSALAVIGGAWHYNAFKDSVGESKMGITVIPTFKLSSADVEGTSFAADTVMQGGTFADCKCFMINSASKANKYEFMQALIKYMSSKSVQDRSFKECLNVPAYSGADAAIKAMYEAKEIEELPYELAASQIKMAEYGIAQPFVTGILNTFYYSKNAPDLLKNTIINEKDAYGTTQKIRESLYTIQYIWQKGQSPASIPSSLPADIA